MDTLIQSHGGTYIRASPRQQSLKCLLAATCHQQNAVQQAYHPEQVHQNGCSAKPFIFGALALSATIIKPNERMSFERIMYRVPETQWIEALLAHEHFLLQFQHNNLNIN